MLAAVGRALTVSVPSSSTTFIRGETSWLSSPLGPFTVTRRAGDVDGHPSGTLDWLSSDAAHRRFRSCGDHQTKATTSPPTPLSLASWPVITPEDVETIAVPIPPCTRGTSSWET